MKKQVKKGFTIVELVIVIAVIAILAAVLIPTFSSLIQKARLSADTQAVREMNVALASDEKLHGKPEDVEGAMQVLANAGYNSKNWVCLTEGYEVYWDKQENQCVLYNSTTAKIEYPEGYAANAMTAAGAADRYFMYNGNFESAIDTDLSLGSSSITPGGIDFDSDDNAQQKEDLHLVLDSLTGSDQNFELKSALGIDKDANVKVYASNTIESDKFGSSYAKVTASVVGTGDFTSDSESAKPNLYTIETVIPAGALPQEREAAQKAAGEYVYSIFVQMNTTSNQDDNTSIVIAEDTTLDLSSHEWKAVNSFSGYFGTSNAEKPVIIDGMELTSKTGYSQTKAMSGHASKYFMTGFIGTLYGNATVENLTFRNLSIESPANDYTISGDKNNRNTVAIIGGILPNDNDRDEAVDVTIRNITVEGSCKIIGEASVGGIVGYIGAEQGSDASPYPSLTGSVLIENCSIACPVESKDSLYIKGGYSPVGGIVGFTVRCDVSAQINIKDCTVTAELKGYGYMGGVVGHIQAGTVNIENCDATGVSFVNAGNCTNTDDDNKYYNKNYVMEALLVGERTDASAFTVDNATMNKIVNAAALKVETLAHCSSNATTCRFVDTLVTGSKITVGHGEPYYKYTVDDYTAALADDTID